MKEIHCHVDTSEIPTWHSVQVSADCSTCGKEYCIIAVKNLFSSRTTFATNIAGLQEGPTQVFSASTGERPKAKVLKGILEPRKLFSHMFCAQFVRNLDLRLL